MIMWIPFLLLLPFVFLAGHLGHFIAAVILSAAIWVILPAKSRSMAKVYIDAVESRMPIFEQNLPADQLATLREQLQSARHDAENGSSFVVLLTAILCLLAFWKVWVAVIGFLFVYYIIHNSVSAK